MNKRLIIASMLTSCSLLFLGCGDSAEETSPTGNTNTTQSTTITGKAVDGYLRYSSVCLDLDDNGYCQIGEEPMTTTDINGSFSLKVTDAHKAHANYKTADLIVYGGQDSDTLKDFNNKIKAPFDGTIKPINITPITTMVAAIKKSGKTHAQAKTAVAKMLGITDEADLEKDPVAQAKAGDTDILNAALQIQKAVEVMTKAAKEDTNNTGKNERDITDSIFEALATATIEEDATTLDAAIIKAATKLPPKARASAKAAIAVMQNVKKAIASNKGTDGKLNIEKIAMVANTIQKVKDKIDIDVKAVIMASDFDEDGTFEFSGLDELADHADYMVSSGELEAEMVRNALEHSGIDVNDTQLADIIAKGEFKAGEFDVDDIKERITGDDFKEMREKIEERQTKNDTVVLTKEMIQNKTFYIVFTSGKTAIAKHTESTRQFKQGTFELDDSISPQDYSIANGKITIGNVVVTLKETTNDYYLVDVVNTSGFSASDTRYYFTKEKAEAYMIQNKTFYIVFTSGGTAIAKHTESTRQFKQGTFELDDSISPQDYSIANGKITIGNVVVTLKETTNDYYLVDVVALSGSFSDTRYYFTKEKAEAYAGSL